MKKRTRKKSPGEVPNNEVPVEKKQVEKIILDVNKPAEESDDLGVLTLKDFNRIEFTQEIRNKVISSMTSDGTYIPTDPESVSALLGALKDMDSGVHKAARLKIEEDKLEEMGVMTDNMASFLKNISPSSVLQYDQDEIKVLKELEIPKDVDITPVPGELELSPGEMDYDSWMDQITNTTDLDD